MSEPLFCESHTMMKFTLTAKLQEGSEKLILKNYPMTAAVENAAAVWQYISNKVQENAEIPLEVNIVPAVSVYPLEKGCPPSGEAIVKIEGYQKDIPFDQWKEYIILMASEFKKVFKQSTVTLEFYNCDVLEL